MSNVRRIWRVCSGLLIALAMFLITMLFPASSFAEPGIEAIGFPIATSPGSHGWSDISGNIVVWTDEGPNVTIHDIVAHDLATKTEFQVTRSGKATSGRVSGNFVVWVDNRSGNLDIYGMDLRTREEFPIATGPAEQNEPRIDGNTVLWTERSDGKSNVLAYDLITKKQFRVSERERNRGAADISGDIVVWVEQGDTYGRSNIIARNLKTGEESSVRISGQEIGYPRISGNFVVWHEKRDPIGYHVFAYDLSARREFKVGSPDRLILQQWPAISGNIVVWEDSRNNPDGPRGIFWNSGIYGFDLATGEEFPVTTTPGIHRQPAISGDVVIWQDARGFVGGGDQHIYGARLVKREAPKDLDFDVPNGHFYSQTNGRPLGTSPLGFAITNDENVRFWDEFKRLGGVDGLGFPASQRFTMDGFTVQLTQGALLQWRLERNQAYLANVFELLERAGLDDRLFSRGIPRSIQDDGSGGDFQKAVQTRLGWMTDEAIKAKFLANPNPDAITEWDQDSSIRLYGLPMSKPERFGPFITQRFQRVAFQLWVDQVPGMPAPGTVVRILGGDLLKEFLVVPTEAILPQLPSSSERAGVGQN